MKILTSKLNHGKTFFATGALALSLVAGSAQAASIFWTSTAAATDADIINTGTLLEAVNFGGASVTANGVTFEAADFSLGALTFDNISGLTYDSNTTYTAPVTGGNIDTIFSTVGFDSPNQNLTMTGLTFGQEYAVQIFVSTTIGGRTFAVASSHSATNATAVADFGGLSVPMNAASIITGTFTADATTQTMKWMESSGSNISNAYQLRNVIPIPVPEPSSTLLLGLGGLALIIRRRR